MAGAALAVLGVCVVVVLACAGIFRTGQLAREGSEKQQEVVRADGSKGKADAIPGFGDSASIGKVAVVIEDAEVRFIPLKSIVRDGQSEDRLLMLRVTVSNRSSTLKVDFRTWADTLRTYCTIRDENGNNYKMIDFGFGTEVVGAVKRGESIYPGKSLSDVLVFEPPVDAAKKLRLELDAERVGESGRFIFDMPTSLVKK